MPTDALSYSTFFFIFLSQSFPPINADSFLPTDVVVYSGGSTFAEEIYPAWFVAYRNQFNSPVALSYNPTGSGIGLAWIKGEQQPRSLYPFPITFAGSDSPLADSDYQKYPQLQMFPSVSGYVVHLHFQNKHTFSGRLW